MSNVGTAMEHWKAHLNVTGDNQQEDNEPQTAADEQMQDDQEIDGEEYAYLQESNTRREGDTQTLAPATEQQAQNAETAQIPKEDNAEGDETVPMEIDDDNNAMEAEMLQPEQLLKSHGQTGARNTMDIDQIESIEEDRELLGTESKVVEIQDDSAEQDVVENRVTAAHEAFAAPESEGIFYDESLCKHVPGTQEVFASRSQDLPRELLSRCWRHFVKHVSRCRRLCFMT